MGVLLGLLVLGDLTVVTYGKEANGGLGASAGTGKRVGIWGRMPTEESPFLLSR